MSQRKEVSVSQDIPLFNGELVVKSDGMYTFAHYYRHPITDRRLIIVGSNHGGDKDYFERITNILEPLDFVLSEGGGLTNTQDNQEEYKAVSQVINSDNPDEAFLPAMQVYFMTVEKTLLLDSEWDYEKPTWIQGDAGFDPFKDKESEQRLQEQERLVFEKISEERKRAVVGYVKSALSKMSEGNFTRKDLGEGFVFFWSDPTIVAAFLEVYGRQREVAVFNNFDKIIAEKNPASIGIKFGAGHTAGLRTHTEQRGYVLQSSIQLKNLAF